MPLGDLEHFSEAFDEHGKAEAIFVVQAEINVASFKRLDELEASDLATLTLSLRNLEIVSPKRT